MSNSSSMTVFDSIEEAKRQVSVCNACRYCEGFCSVFPAMHQQRVFSNGDLVQLANLCHNCRGCYYACQYSDPHEFNINLPAALANLRLESWERFIKPNWLARLFQRHGLWVSALLIVVLSFLLLLVMQIASADGAGFYRYLSHTIMISIFIPAFLLPLYVVARGLKAYWMAVSGERVRYKHIVNAVKNVATMKNLDGGQGQGCNFEQGDRYSNKRRYAHQLTLYGFLLCFASTVSGTVLHYAFGIEAPHGLLSLPKLLGIPGGLLLTIGCVCLAWLKLKSDSSLNASNSFTGELAFVLVLGATGATGLLLYLLGTSLFGTSELLKPMLAIHLATVFTFFISMPFSKMVHGFFRMAALVRHAQIAQP